MSEYPGHKSLGRMQVQSLLPNEPCLLISETQQLLTNLHLSPILPALESFLCKIRCQIDMQMQQTQPVKFGKKYPLGQCLEITLLAQKYFENPIINVGGEEDLIGYRAFDAFRRAGGSIRHVWGDLRGEYFQNAFQIGSLYVDMANDTVVSTKPKIEILPFMQANFVPIRDYFHFKDIAQRYWRDRVYPNHLLPELAPYFPLLHINELGQISVRYNAKYMLCLNLIKKFEPAQSILSGEILNEITFDELAITLKDCGAKLALDPYHGRQKALHHCQLYLERSRFHDDHEINRLINTANRINAHLHECHMRSSRYNSLKESLVAISNR
jgi:hypothetical protein